MCGLFLYGLSICGSIHSRWLSLSAPALLGSGLLKKGSRGKESRAVCPLGVDPARCGSKATCSQEGKNGFGVRRLGSGKHRHCGVLDFVFRSGPFPWSQSVQMLLAAPAPYSLDGYHCLWLPHRFFPVLALEAFEVIVFSWGGSSGFWVGLCGDLGGRSLKSLDPGSDSGRVYICALGHDYCLLYPH